MADLTINQLVRRGLRLSTAQYSDGDIEFKIKQSLVFVNTITAESKTIADYDDATTGDLYFDELLAQRCIWSIHTEIYNQSVTRGDELKSVKHLGTIWRDEFLLLLSARYPGLVDIKQGVISFKDKSFANTDVGVTDGRHDATDAAIFDQSTQFNG